MAHCKDCIHVEVCREYIAGLAAARGVELDTKEIETVLESDDCEHLNMGVCMEFQNFVPTAVRL